MTGRVRAWLAGVSAAVVALGAAAAQPVVGVKAVENTLDDAPKPSLRSPDLSTCDVDVADFGAVGDGVTDDTRAIQAALWAGTDISIRQPGTYVISGTLVRESGSSNAKANAALVIPSGRRLAMARGVTLKLATGSHCYMIRNAGWATGDSDIVIEGGAIDANQAGQIENLDFEPYWFGHAVLLHRVNRVTLRDLYSTNPRMYSVLFSGCNDILVERIQFLHDRRNSDGIHVNGPTRGVVIRDLWGRTWDNMVGLIAAEVDYFRGLSDLTLGAGDIRDVLVERVTTFAGKEPVRLAGPEWTTLENITIRSVSGEVADGMGIALMDDEIGRVRGAVMSRIVIEGVAVSVLPNYAAVGISAAGLRDVKIRNVTVLRPDNLAVYIDAKPGSFVDLPTLEIEGLQGWWMERPVVKVGGSPQPTRVRRLVGRDWGVRMGGGGMLIDQEGAIDEIELTNVSTTGGLAMFKRAGLPEGVVRTTNLRLGGGCGGFSMMSPATIELWNARAGGLSTRVVNAGSAVRVVGDGMVYGPGIPSEPVQVLAGGSIGVRHPQFRMRGPLFTAVPTEGDTFFNTEAVVPPWGVLGVGRVEYVGGVWVRR